MGDRSIELELHPDTVTKIREKLVGTVAHVQLLSQSPSQQQGNHAGIIGSVSSKLSCFNPRRPRDVEQRPGEPDAFLLLTADSVEVSVPICPHDMRRACPHVPKTFSMS